jgi:hypothetical protein
MQPMGWGQQSEVQQPRRPSSATSCHMQTGHQQQPACSARMLEGMPLLPSATTTAATTLKRRLTRRHWHRGGQSRHANGACNTRQPQECSEVELTWAPPKLPAAMTPRPKGSSLPSSEYGSALRHGSDASNIPSTLRATNASSRLRAIGS